MDSQKAISITIAHAAHAEERKATLARMLEALPPHARIDTTPGKPQFWALAQWQAGLEESPAYCCYLNDDLILCDRFYDVLERVLVARPNHVINLYNAHPAAIEAQRRGLSWITSPDGLIGNAYVMPAASVKEFLEWRVKVTDEGLQLLSEDQLLNLWVMSKHAIVWHTVPALVDHDTSVPSLFGNTQVRKPMVGPKPNMLEVDWNTDGIHQGRMFTGNHWGLVRFMRPEFRDIERAYALHGDVAPV